MFDYCCSTFSPRQRGLIDLLESPVKMFLRSINLGVPPNGSTDDHYCQRLQSIGWDCLVLRRVKCALLFAYKLVVGIIPLGDQIFEVCSSELNDPSVLGSSRSQTQLQRHPLPIRIVKSGINASRSCTSERSFSFMVEKIWNRLTFPAPAYSNLRRFSAALDSFNWRSLSYVLELLGHYAGNS